MLQAPHDDAGVDTDACGKSPHSLFGAKRTECAAVCLWYQYIARPLIGFLLE